MSWRASSFALAMAYLLGLVYSGAANAVVQDPMEAHAQSFGWLAIRNFTFCMSRHPDPPNKPLGIQPTGTTLSTSDRRKPRTTGMGDSVVVLYHPEQPQQPIAWCNTLVAFTSTKHMKCHTALPTCQRCDAVRSGQEGGKNGQPAQAAPPAGAQAAGQSAGQGKAQDSKPANQPESDQGIPRRRLDPPATQDQDDKGLVSLTRRGETTSSQPGKDPTSQPQDKTARSFGTPSSSSSQDFLADATLQEAIHEFQDFCENKLTLAVRADCPLHVVRGWLDEPPFDLHRFCSSQQGNVWVHHGPRHRDSNADASAQSKDDQGKGSTKQPEPVTGEARSRNVDPHYERGAFDPNDPIVPWPEDKGS
ncbi:uncharacterized protein PAN0_008c3435 [Moesziomyces antarcticus]|uniref:Uncharacterized protein n=2 Tax=Pseudozyma antarctica TaxID=84753 RepID=A0A081CEX2_PSEA2|nr:uncharacterized protein PAN0_008c3435 [Moesziomyces antarcticus]GAK65218.1 conserved hypothetical protein [Moesziomyces antarcticus]SPO46219.1 uncharacterized protein PSANT_03905 [Moesziomyces antarcticus]